MPYCTPHELEALWCDAGLDPVHVGPAIVTAAYDGFEDLWQPLELGVGPSGVYVAGLADDQRAAFKAEFRRRLGAGDEPFRLSARAWLVTGSVPGESAAEHSFV